MLKLRTGFVSNSSSSSFVIQKDKMTAEQIVKIRNHIEEGAKLELAFVAKNDEWEIKETPKFIKGSTFMDNFSMVDFLREIGVDADKDVEWDDHYTLGEEFAPNCVLVEDGILLSNFLDKVDAEKLNAHECIQLHDMREEVKEQIK